MDEELEIEKRDENFNYADFWKEEEKENERRINKEIEKLPKGNPRKGIKGRYIKPKHYISRRSSMKAMKSFVYSEKYAESS